MYLPLHLPHPLELSPPLIFQAEFIATTPQPIFPPHASQDINVTLEFVDDVLSSLIEHVIEWLELLSVLV